MYTNCYDHRVSLNETPIWVILSMMDDNKLQNGEVKNHFSATQ